MTKADFFASILPATLNPVEQAHAYAPSNIALSKYWGKRDAALNLPCNGSLSISLGDLGTHTTVTLAERDLVTLNGEDLPRDHEFVRKVIAFVDHFRREQQLPLHIDTRNTVPTAAGLASSASGFAALTLALNQLFRLDLPDPTLSAIARIGSGSAARSLWHGFVEWQRGTRDDGRDSIARPIDSPWRTVRIGLLELNRAEKHTSSRDGMTHTAATSPLFAVWPEQAERDRITIRRAIANEDFHALGATAEANALAMHATMLAARPLLTYFQPETLATILNVQHLRADGLALYLTIDAGPNVKLLYRAQDEGDVRRAFPEVLCINPFAAHSA